MLRVRFAPLIVLLLATASFAEERDFATAQLPAIEITGPLTRIHVTGWDEDHISLSASDLENIHVEQNDERVSIDIGYPPVVWLSVSIPPSRSLVINGELADVTIESVTGDVSAFTTNNPISIRGVEGSVDAKSFLAPVSVFDVHGDVRAESNHADVKLGGIRGDVWARTAIASVSLKDSESDRVELQTLNGVINFEGLVGSGADYLLASHRGVVNALLFQGSNVTAVLQGDPEDFESNGAKLTSRSHNQSEAIIGSGKGRLTIQSPGGPIHLSVTDTD